MAGNATTIATVASTSYPAVGSPSWDPGAQGKITLIHLGDSSVRVTFSFDGSTDAGTLVPGTPAASMTTDTWRNRKVWLKGSAATSTSVELICETEVA